MNKYFVVCIGRSGSTWLSNLLGCSHETGDVRSKVIPQPWTPFPLQRWTGADDYGEVNGMLRYHLSAQYLGDEMKIPKRVYLRRRPLDIIASWMLSGRSPRSNRQQNDLSATAQEVLWHANNLEKWCAASSSRQVDVETLWASVTETQNLVDHLLGTGKLQVTKEMMRPRNQTPSSVKATWQWTPEELATVQRAAARVGYEHEISAL